MFLSTSELYTHLYGEVTSEINRGDDTVTQAAVDAAVEEATGYLSAFDTVTTFAQTGTSRNPALLMFIKDLAVWHFIQLCNPNVDLEFRHERYKGAVKWLEKVQAGIIVPTLPLPVVTAPEQLENFIKWGSNHKRRDYFN